MAVKSGARRKSQVNQITHSDKKSKAKASLEQELRDQYYVIRDDILKLRDDLTKGVEMAKQWMDKKGHTRKLLRK